MNRLVARGAFVLIGLTLAGCASRPAEHVGPGDPTAPVVESPAPRTPVVTPPMGPGLSPDRAGAVLQLLLSQSADDTDAVRRALLEIVDLGDVRFIAPLIELVRVGPARLARFDQAHLDALEALSGVALGRDWIRWVEWYSQTSLSPPPGFTGWKGRLFSGIDPRFAEFLRDDWAATIPVEAIVWGGVPVDGITPLDRPPVLPSAQASYMDPREPVFGLVAGGEARAYPLRIMDAHEMANDLLGEVPVSLTYCTLCGTAIAYDGRGPDGTVYTFSTSGLLYENNKLMYDRQTGTLWSQFIGRPALGPLVGAAEGTRGPWLEMLPVVLTTWESWVAQHPETTVLDIETGIGTGYTLGYPYLEYFASGDVAFPLAQRSGTLNAKEWIFGIRLGDATKAYRVDALTHAGVVNDTVGGVDLVVVAPGPVIDVHADAGRLGELSYEAGGEVRAYARPAGVEFERGQAPAELIDHAGRQWTVTEGAIIGPGGERGERIVGQLSFWFGWYSFFPRTEVFGGRE